MTTTFRTKLDDLKSRGLGTMKTNPMLWAGIAAGSGFALGLAGRIADSRRKNRRMYPDLVIIDATC